MKLGPQMSVREVIQKYPATVAVFERHGLMGCGGAQGPIEPLQWFAEVHHVDFDTLLRELQDAARSPSAAAPQPIPAARLAQENFYRRFLKAALLFTFTGGAALGAVALIVMGLRGEMGGIGRGLIQVHGHYQLFGWVGLFVIGVAYHILPRLTGVPLPSYRLASWSFALLVTGTILRTAQALDPSVPRTGLLFGGALMELAGCSIFLWSVVRILSAQSGRPQPYQTYLAAGTGWLVVSAVLNLAHAWYLAARAAFEVPPFLNIPYLTIFLIGFVAHWILGVSLRTLPVFMGLASRPAVAGALPIPLTAALAVLASGEGVYLAEGRIGARLAFGLGGLGVAICLTLAAWSIGIFGRAAGAREPGIDRGYEKFLRLGYAWLVISAAMLATFAVMVMAGQDMDHAFVGAYRHAITVGFITTVMVGMASRIVPVFRGVRLYSAPLREASFWLLAVGNAMRVVFQSVSGLYGGQWLKITSVSGVLELAGLLLFGFNLWKTLDLESVEEVVPAGTAPAIARQTRVGEVLAAYPALLSVFVSHGFAPLANPILRRTMARWVSIGQACQMHGVEVDRFLAALQDAKARLYPAAGPARPAGPPKGTVSPMHFKK